MNANDSIAPAFDLDDLRAAHGVDITRLDASGVTVVVRAPTRAEYKRFRAESLDDKRRADAVENLCRSCVVWPDAAEFSRILDRKPALADIFGAKVLDAAGATAEAEAVKL